MSAAAASKPSKAAVPAGAPGVRSGVYEFNPMNAHSDRGKAHAAALQQQTLQPLMPVPLHQRKGLLFAAAVLCAVLAFVLHTCQAANVFLKLRPHHTDGCRVLTGPVGSEDLALDGRGVAFISSDARSWVPHVQKDGWTTAADIPKRMAAISFDEQGAIWAYDTRPPTGENASPTSGQLVKLEIEGLPAAVTDVHPHGISLPKQPGLSADEPSFLYVLNHQRDGDVVLVLEIQYAASATSTDDVAATPASSSSSSSSSSLWPPRLLFRGLIRDASTLKQINDAAALYPVRQEDGSWLHGLFVTNFLGSKLGDSAWMLLENFTQARWGSVAFCHAVQPGSLGPGELAGELESNCTRAVPEGISTPNGIALSTDKRSLYVASTLKMELRVYDLPPSVAQATRSHGSIPLLPLRLTHTLPLRTGLDNIDVDAVTGDLLIGSHPKPLRAMAHLADAAERSPTQVIRVHRRSAEELADAKSAAASSAPASPRAAAAAAVPSEFVLSELVLSEGEEFSGSSVGVRARASNQLLIGGVSQDGIYVCSFPKEEELRFIDIEAERH